MFAPRSCKIGFEGVAFVSAINHSVLRWPCIHLGVFLSLPPPPCRAEGARSPRACGPALLSAAPPAPVPRGRSAAWAQREVGVKVHISPAFPTVFRMVPHVFPHRMNAVRGEVKRQMGCPITSFQSVDPLNVCFSKRGEMRWPTKISGGGGI